MPSSLRVTSDWQLPQHNIVTRKESEGSCHLFHVNNSGHEKSRYTLIFMNHSFLESEGVHVSSITLVHNEMNDIEVLDISHGTYSKNSCNDTTDHSVDDCSLEMVLYVKERFGLSNAAYHELSMVCRGLLRYGK